MGHAQQSVCEQVYGRRLREGNFHRHVSKRAVPGLWVRHALVTMLLSDWLRAVCYLRLKTPECSVLSSFFFFSSQSGVVNVYSQEACLNSANPKPLKAVMNLLTSATALTFNPTSEILAIASRAEDEAVRLVRDGSDDDDDGDDEEH